MQLKPSMPIPFYAMGGSNPEDPKALFGVVPFTAGVTVWTGDLLNLLQSKRFQSLRTVYYDALDCANDVTLFFPQTQQRVVIEAGHFGYLPVIVSDQMQFQLTGTAGDTFRIHLLNVDMDPIDFPSGGGGGPFPVSDLTIAAAPSVVGGNVNGPAIEITAATNDRLLARTAGAIAFQQLTNGMVPVNTIGLDKLANASAQYNLIGRSTAGAGAWEQKATSADTFSLLGAANFAAMRTLLSLGSAALLGVASAADVRLGTSTAVLMTPGSNASAAFKAYRTTNQTGLADATFTKIQFDTEALDVGGWYDNVTNFRWTPQSARPVALSLSARMDGTIPAGNTVYCAIYKNGALFAVGRPIQAIVADVGNACVPTVSDIPNGTTDFYEAYAFIDVSAGTGGVGNAMTNCYFTGQQI